jgi:cytoskeleton protein RodZ
MDEPEFSQGSRELPMSLASDECLDDRPPAESTLGRALQTGTPEPPGVFLRERREARGLTLDDIARTTKIGKPTLRAIESSDVLHLPAAIYTRGFVKAYAREVGLDPATTADEYLDKIEPLRSHHLLVDDGVLPPLSDSHTHVDVNGDARNLLAENQVRRFGRLTVLAAAVGLILYLGSFGRGDETIGESGVAPDEELSDAARAGGPAPDASSPADVAPASIADRPLRVELIPQGPCWVAARVDGERVVAKLLQAGERQTLDISDEAFLRVGDPGALSISINGQIGRPLGPPGQPITVRITKDNFREFLSS